MAIEENKQHEWVSEWYYDCDVGDYWDDHCCNCFKFRDWSKDESDQGICISSELP